jgi:electron transport complex protein RnfB
MHDNLPRVDASRPARERRAIERCPTGAILWVDRDGRSLRGDAAKPVIRQGALPETAT